VEALFAELNNQIGLRRLCLRRLKFVREQFFLAAVAQNIKRLVRFPQPTHNTYYGSCHLAGVRGKTRWQRIIAANSTFPSRTFSTPTGDSTHPMREDVKQEHFSTPLRETSIGACIQAPSSSWRGFWF
jgi:hypothetical protein